jgi:hypothetical protein
MRQQLDTQRKRHLIKVPEKLHLAERFDIFRDNEIELIYKRLERAWILDGAKTKALNSSLRCVQWELEEAELKNLTNPDGKKSKQYHEYE